ncbi:MAG: EAL domain-containing protein [Prochlorococcaceae cyanobacterium]
MLVLAAAIAAIYALDALFTQSVPLLGFYWVPVLLATSFAGVRQVALLSLLALVLATAIGLQQGVLGSGEYPLRLLAVFAISLVSLRLTQVRQRQERQLLATTSELEATLQAIPDKLFEVDRRGLVLKAQAHQEAWVLQPTGQMLGRRLDQLLPPAAAAESLEALAEADRDGFSFGRQICLPLAGGEHWFELSVARKWAPRDREPTFVVLSRDIQSRKQAETALQRQIGFYKVLSRCGRAMESCGNRIEMLQAVCQEAVRTGDLTMAWAGLLDPQTRMIQPVAMAGEGLAYLEGLQISADADSPHGQGPTGQCVRNAQPFWCQDFCHDPATAAWHERGRRSGWGASASLPLCCRGQVVGAINLYAPVPHAFSKEIKVLLLDMVVGVDLALERFRHQEQQQEVQQALERSERLYRQLTESIHDVIWRIDAQSLTTRYVSPAVQQLLGYRPQDLEGLPVQITLHDDSLDWLAAIRSLAGGDRQQQAGEKVSYRVDEVQQRHSDGSSIWSEITTTLGSHELTGELEFSCVCRDITARKRAESQLEWLAYYDPLTDLPNRTHINSLLEQVLRTANRENEPLACLLLGLDHFKAINDSIGYETGDAVLREVAQRLTQRLRENDLVGRIGSDEFLVALPGADATDAAQLCERLQESLREPFALAQNTIHLTSSIGIALFPADGNDRETLLRKAATAMSEAKREGRDRVHFFTASLEQQVMLQVRLAKALYGALDREEMRLVYQPQVDARTGEVLGAEALLRWNHHGFGNISPQEFIPIAESTGLILPIGEWVLHEAIQQLKRWQDRGLAIQTMAVNLSAVQFRQLDLAERVLRYLEAAALSCPRLELELTESVLIGDPEAAIAAMDHFSSAGIQLSIDDFGTGYSSLSYLKRLRVNKLKIDASFVRGLGTGLHDTSIVQAIINLAKDLQMETIAEGVEEASQLEALRQMGCDQIQGYFFAKPMPPDEFEAFARRQPQPAADSEL